MCCFRTQEIWKFLRRKAALLGLPSTLPEPFTFSRANAVDTKRNRGLAFPTLPSTQSSREHVLSACGIVKHAQVLLMLALSLFLLQSRSQGPSDSPPRTSIYSSPCTDQGRRSCHWRTWVEAEEGTCRSSELCHLPLFFYYIRINSWCNNSTINASSTSLATQAIYREFFTSWRDPPSNTNQAKDYSSKHSHFSSRQYCL